MIDKKSLALGMALGRWNLLKTGGVGLYAVRGPVLRRFPRRQAAAAAAGAVGPAVLVTAEGWMFTGEPTGRTAAAFVSVTPAITVGLTAGQPVQHGVFTRTAAGNTQAAAGTAETIRFRMESDTYA